MSEPNKYEKREDMTDHFENKTFQENMQEHSEVQNTSMQNKKYENNISNSEQRPNYLVPTKRSNITSPCKRCGLNFRDGHKMQRHIKSKHSKRDKQVKCRRTFCSKLFDTLEEQQKHTSSCILKCTVQGCKRQFTIESNVEAHKRFHQKLPRGYCQRTTSIQEEPDDKITFKLKTTKAVKNTVKIPERLQGIWDSINLN